MRGHDPARARGCQSFVTVIRLTHVRAIADCRLQIADCREANEPASMRPQVRPANLQSAI
jgi:hypothetical protein